MSAPPFAVHSDDGHLQGDVLAGGGNRLLGHDRKTPAAGDFHDGHGDRPDVVVLQNRGQLLHIGAGVVELGAGVDQHLVLDEVPVELRVGERRAVGGDEQVRALQPGRGGRNQMELGRPLAQFRADTTGGGLVGAFLLLDGTNVGAGASAGKIFHGLSPLVVRLWMVAKFLNDRPVTNRKKPEFATKAPRHQV
jgi:hypothetical protein